MFSSEINEISGALAAAQSQFPVIVKDRRASIHSAKGNYEYRYVSLSRMLEAVQPCLAAQGICFAQPLDSNEHGSYLVTLLLHRSGQWIASRLRIPELNDPQALGSFISYARRYSLASITGLAVEDDDGQLAKAKSSPREPGSDDERPTASSESVRPMVRDGPWFAEAVEKQGSTSVYREIGEFLRFPAHLAQWTPSQVKQAIEFRREQNLQ
jgi:ERF superfamily